MTPKEKTIESMNEIIISLESKVLSAKCEYNNKNFLGRFLDTKLNKAKTKLKRAKRFLNIYINSPHVILQTTPYGNIRYIFPCDFTGTIAKKLCKSLSKEHKSLYPSDFFIPIEQAEFEKNGLRWFKNYINLQ